MISNEEMAIFVREVYLLINEYYRCKNPELKEQIMNQIFLLSEVIKP